MRFFQPGGNGQKGLTEGRSWWEGKDLVQCESRMQRGAVGCSCKQRGVEGRGANGKVLEGSTKWEGTGDLRSEVGSWARYMEKDGKSEMEGPSLGQRRYLTILSRGLWNTVPPGQEIMALLWDTQLAVVRCPPGQLAGFGMACPPQRLLAVKVKLWKVLWGLPCLPLWPFV